MLESIAASRSSARVCSPLVYGPYAPPSSHRVRQSVTTSPRTCGYGFALAEPFPPRPNQTALCSIRRVPVLPPDVLRTVPFGTGVILLRSAPPIVTDLRPWARRPDAGELTMQQEALEARLREGNGP